MDPATAQWQSPLDREVPREKSAFFKALEDIDADIPPEWMPTAAGIAALVDRYRADAATADQEAAIGNLASLLRHASGFAASLCREIEHYAAEARDAKAEVRKLRDRLAEVQTLGSRLNELGGRVEKSVYGSHDDTGWCGQAGEIRGSR